MNARFKLVTGSQRRDEQDPNNLGVIVGLSGAYQARNASQSPPFEMIFDATKVEKQLPTRTVKSDDALTKNNLVACFSTRPIFCARSQSATSDPFNTRLLGSSADFVSSPLWSVVEECELCARWVSRCIWSRPQAESVVRRTWPVVLSLVGAEAHVCFAPDGYPAQGSYFYGAL